MQTIRIVLACLLCIATSSGLPGQTLELVNNQPFDVRMPMRLRGVKLDGNATSSVSPLAQQAGDDLFVMIDAPPSQTKKLSFDTQGANSNAGQRAVILKPDENGLPISVAGQDMGRLSWGVVVGPAPAEKKKGEPAPSTKRDFAETFKPIALMFERVGEGPLLETWKAQGSAKGLKLDLELHAYRTGFLDLHTTVTNQSAPQTDVYAAVICRWEHPSAADRTLCYDNRRQKMQDTDHSPFREGEGRHLYIQRGVDWINTRLGSGGNVLWMNDFSPSFTVHKEASESKSPSTGIVTKHGPRWIGANTAQLAQEAQAKDGALYSITEIARPNIPQYRSRLDSNVLPDEDQPLKVTYRMAFDPGEVTDNQADQCFVGYAGYNPQQVTTIGAKVMFGVPFTRMGTNYFPFSTLGENFGDLRMEGMSKEGYWPLAPQTVLQWEKFADDIRRDLRILKAMGFEFCRLHHVELLWDKDKNGADLIPAEKRWEYLDFFFSELDKLQLKALLDVKLPAKDVAELVKRYRKLVDGVEYDNEILIFQIYDEDVPVWKEVYDAVKQVAPDMPFHLTAHTNTGAFDRIAKLGVKSDRIGQHAYLDGVEPIPSSRGYALAVANYAAKAGKEPLITEWNWRFLTRMPMDERAKIYPPIFENVLAARSMPIVYQFQFQDSLAMNPDTLKGIRRYEQLLLSRRPKPEAFEMMRMIEQYGSPDSGVKRIGCERRVLELTEDAGEVTFEVVNRTDEPMPIVLAVESSSDVKASLGGRRETVLNPKATLKVPVKISFAGGEEALPGFYHVFLRVHAADDTLRYGWGEVRRPGAPKFAESTNEKVTYGPDALEFDFNRPLTIVYPDEASVLELEAAWTVFITLESATGRPADIFQMSDFEKRGQENTTVVLVERQKGAEPSVIIDGRRLLITGGNEKEVAAACMDFVIRFWKNAKDAGARKVGLVAAPKAEAGGKTDLD